MTVNARNTEVSNVKKVRNCLWPRRILWGVGWTNTGVAVCAIQSRDEAVLWSPVPQWRTAAHGPHPLSHGYASLPGCHLAPGSSAQPLWRFSSGRRPHSNPPGGRVHLSLPAGHQLLAAPPPSPAASGLGLQEPDRPSGAIGHTGGSYCCSCYWRYSSSTETWGLNESNIQTKLSTSNLSKANYIYFFLRSSEINNLKKANPDLFTSFYSVFQ